MLIVCSDPLLVELHALEFSVYEIGLSQMPDLFLDHPNKRVECLWACVNALKSWINLCLRIPIVEYHGFSAMMYANLSCYFVGVYRLATFEHSEWDRTIPEETLQVSLFLGEFQRNFSLVKDAVGLDLYGSTEIDFFTKMSGKLGIIKKNWDTVTENLTGSNGTIPNFELDDVPMDFSDENWLRDLLETWNE